MAISFALACCLCAAVNDFVFRLYARKSRSRGAYVLVIGIVWMLVFAFFADFSSVPEPGTLFWGIVSGVFSVVANILLIEGMSHNEVGVCATIFRLNLVVVALGAFWLLGEDVTVLKIMGVSFASVAVLMFFPSWRRDHTNDKAKLGFYLVGIAALLRAGMGLSYKYAFLQQVDRNALLFINGALWVIGGLVYLALKERHLLVGTGRKSWTYGTLSGLLICGIVLFMALALQDGDAAVVLPMSQMSFLGTWALGILLLGEKLSVKKLLGLAAGILCIICMGFSS